MSNGWELAAAQRRLFADTIADLSDEQAASPSLCAEWSVHNTAAHLLMFTNMSFPRFMGNMFKNGFNYDKMSTRVARRFSEQFTLGEIADELRKNADKKSAMPGFPGELTLTDVTIHLQDIRRPLGLGVDIDPEVALASLNFMTTHKQAKAIFDPKRLDGVRLVATDIGWTSGSGSEVSGPAEAIMLALAGRPVAADLEGEGVALLLPS